MTDQARSFARSSLSGQPPPPCRRAARALVTPSRMTPICPTSTINPSSYRPGSGRERSRRAGSTCPQATPCRWRPRPGGCPVVERGATPARSLPLSRGRRGELFGGGGPALFVGRERAWWRSAGPDKTDTSGGRVIGARRGPRPRAGSRHTPHPAAAPAGRRKPKPLAQHRSPGALAAANRTRCAVLSGFGRARQCRQDRGRAQQSAIASAWGNV